MNGDLVKHHVKPSRYLSIDLAHDLLCYSKGIRFYDTDIFVNKFTRQYLQRVHLPGILTRIR